MLHLTRLAAQDVLPLGDQLTRVLEAGLVDAVGGHDPIVPSRAGPINTFGHFRPDRTDLKLVA
jgi:hypothetical protein